MVQAILLISSFDIVVAVLVVVSYGWIHLQHTRIPSHLSAVIVPGGTQWPVREGFPERCTFFSPQV